ncbi:TIGR01906 family membrane protein [Enteractinococcus coprophilus]|uniref:Integral membrane protein (TIGR01906 family) n=1 Tax=Enteractinococcus coprophilus TaxID=1027633 RepID=A0A543AFD2_9MICC|nr:TIGR01906 family membrane protein [Enteractinococcus coprophilus]TQL71283.1 integral membrane protein (TIGR01906 family) [Enteractinococcus coprophilus]
MSKQSKDHRASSNDGDAARDPETVPLEGLTPGEDISPAEPVATPRRQRRRIDPDGDALETAAAVGIGPRNHPRPGARPAPGSEFSADPPAAPLHEPATRVTPPPPPINASTGSSAAPRPGAGAFEPLEDSFEDAAAARAKARDRAAVGSPTLVRVLQVVLAILAPLVILIAMIRLVASPVFLWFEYHRPGFPADQFGMAIDQRLTLGSYGLDYLFNLAPSAYLGDLRFANGNPVFTNDEVAHMADVKQVMMITMIAGLLAAIVCVVAMIMLYRMRKGAIARALFAGAVWFTVVMSLLAVVAVFGWQAFFAGFHQLFFAEGTWTFATSDSLIRLYPGQFWVDAAAWVGGLTLVVMIVILLVTAPTARRRQRREQAQRFLESQVTGQTGQPRQP